MVRGSYCSRRCFDADRGESALARIADDHRWCGTCFRPIKEIEPPPDGVSVTVGPPEHPARRDTDLVADVLVGYQYPTEHMERAVDEFGGAGDGDARPLQRTRWACECGAVDPHDQHDLVRDQQPEQTAAALWAALARLAKEDTFQQNPDPSRFKTALREYGYDWAGLAGRTLHE